MAFTPGPWKWQGKADGRPSGYDIAVLFSNGSGRRILSKYGRAGRFALGTSEEDIANARLIAAAPEMYAALEAIVGEAAFEGLPECKQEAIIAALSKAVT